ncbi:hypothetical protein LTR62_001082 [Meristemomyces frigidus]|uniref:DM2 domain-containing protein n=1 Tax=Meristemomyces frigidus TaxID=1508187 RepID=A0AAN7TJZ4_9PEZI|nr:hypothetical protein LTR62_001082 [Meristemomyces frigidus]
MATAGHKRKISFADLERTFRAAGSMVPPPQHAQQAQQPPTAAQLQAARLEDHRRQDAARRISKKPTDREIPDELSGVIVGDGVERYQKLRDVERRLDAVMMRKRLNVSDDLQRRYTRREGTLRVWISNTADGQPWQIMEEGSGMGEDGGFEIGDNSQATFRVKIEGRLLEEQEEESMGKGKEAEDEVKQPPQKRARFSNFFKAITIDFSRHPSDDYTAIEWQKPVPSSQNPNYDPNSSEVSFDSLEFGRKGEENINVTIKLARDEKNERCKLSPLLAEILDTEEEDRAGAVQGVWEYCRAMGLQEDEDKRSIVCDEPLRRLFKQDKIYFPYVPDLLLPHLEPLPPLQLHYTIRTDKAYISSPTQTIYDLRVPLPNPTKAALSRFHTSKTHLASLQQIVKADDDLALLCQGILQQNGKRRFYEQCARDPAGFVRRWVRSQGRDLEVLVAESGRIGGGNEEGLSEEWRAGGTESVWGSQGAREGVGMWLARAKH